MRAFFSLLSRHGVSPFPLAELVREVSPATVEALRAEGIVRPAQLARAYACGADEPGCAREVRGFEDDDDLGVGEDDARTRLKDSIAPAGLRRGVLAEPAPVPARRSPRATISRR